MPEMFRKVYDPLTGRMVREIKSNDIVNISTDPTYSASGADEDVVSYTADNYTQVFITGIVVTTDTADTGVYIQVDGTTVLSIPSISASTPVVITTQRNAPIIRIPPGSTLTVKSTGAATLSVSLFGVKEPTTDYVETD